MTALADNLRRWQADAVAWAEENVWVRSPATGKIGPLVLADHQREWLREATRRDDRGRLLHKVAVASWPKREGKTLVVSLLIAHRTANFAEQRSGIIANSERQAQSNIFDAVCGFFRNSPNLQGLVPEDGFAARRLQVPALGNSVECFPANYRTVQGTAFTGILACDELHASEDGGKAYTFASQQTEAEGAAVVIASQAGAPVNANPLWRLYQARDQESIFFDYRTELACPWSIDRAEKARAELLPAEFDYLWGNAWGATGIKLLPATDVEAAALAYREPQTREQWEALREAWGWEKVSPAIGVGLDRAGVSVSGDRTVWTVTARFDVDGAEFFRVLRCAVLPTGSEAEVLAEAKRTREIFGRPAQTLFEAYGCSDVVEKVQGAELASPTTQRQSGLFNRLHRLFVEGRIAFPAEAGVDPKTKTTGLLKAELVAFEYDAEREGNTRFGTQRGHDDAAYSLAWSCEAVGAARPRSVQAHVL